MKPAIGTPCAHVRQVVVTLKGQRVQRCVWCLSITAFLDAGDDEHVDGDDKKP